MSPRMPAHPMTPAGSDSSTDLSYFCIEKDTLELLMKTFSLSDRILEVVDESPRRIIGSISFDRSSYWTAPIRRAGPHLRYVMRTEKHLPLDLALAVTWDADKEAVHAFLHGVTNKDAKHIEEWLTSIQGAIRHPLAPALAIIELQLARHGKLYREHSNAYGLQFYTIATAAGKSLQGRSSPDSGLLGFNVTEELDKVFNMLQQFGNFHRLLSNFRQVVVAVQEMCTELGTHASFKDLPTIHPYNIAIADSLQDSLRDYDDLLEQSRGLSENVSLLLTTIWSAISQANNAIAQDANRINQQISNSSRQIAIATGNDSSAMKALAVITMVFLPATSVAAILAMPAFDWNSPGSSSGLPAVKPGFWIWGVSAVILTVLVLYSWRVWYLRSVWKRGSDYYEEWKRLETEHDLSTKAPGPYPKHRAWLLKHYTDGLKGDRVDQKQLNGGVVARSSGSQKSAPQAVAVNV